MTIKSVKVVTILFILLRFCYSENKQDYLGEFQSSITNFHVVDSIINEEFSKFKYKHCNNYYGFDKAFAKINGKIFSKLRKADISKDTTYTKCLTLYVLYKGILYRTDNYPCKNHNCYKELKCVSFTFSHIIYAFQLMEDYKIENSDFFTMLKRKFVLTLIDNRAHFLKLSNSKNATPLSKETKIIICNCINFFLSDEIVKRKLSKTVYLEKEESAYNIQKQYCK